MNKLVKIVIVLLIAVSFGLISQQTASAATFTVTNTNDAGAGSLRAAITAANGAAGADTINFAIADSGVQTITLESDLPAITEEVLVDGLSQTGATCGEVRPDSGNGTPHNLLIEIDGTAVIEGILTLEAGSDNSTIRGLVLNRAADARAIWITEPGFSTPISDLTIDCNYIGTDPTGTTASSNTNGVTIQAIVEDLAVTNNLISANDENILIEAIITNGSITNNLVGSSITGTDLGALDNVGVGALLSSGDTITIANNTVGYSDGGIALYGIDTTNIFVVNNLVHNTNLQAITYLNFGTNEYSISDNTITQNQGAGLIFADSQGDLTVANNIITSNVGYGVDMEVASPSAMDFANNRIGVNAEGVAAGNGSDGIIVRTGSQNYSIGSGNVISANAGNGIHIESNCSTDLNINSTIQGNLIGTNPAGQIVTGFGNQGSGVQINEYIDEDECAGPPPPSVYNHLIGGTESSQANTIAGNAQDGVRIFQYVDPEDPSVHADVFSNTVIGNRIFGNGNLGINLARDTTNDGWADADLGPNMLNDFLVNYPATEANNYLNHPTISNVAIAGNNLTLTYNFLANDVETSQDGVSMLTADLVGYRLDFYINTGGQDGAYQGYAQGSHHLGSFMVDGAELNATHTFTSPIPVTGQQNITATATLLWTTEPGPATTPRSCDGQTAREGVSPPYQYSGTCPL